MVNGTNDSFDAFAASEWEALIRMARVLTGDWHAAQDLAQETLARMWRAWPKLCDQGAALSYARTTMVRLHLREQRRLWHAPPLILEEVRRAADNRHRRAIISVTGAAVMVAATAVGGNLLLTGTAPQTIAQDASPPCPSGTNRIARMAPGCSPNSGSIVATVGETVSTSLEHA